ncbi:Ubiquitin-protein ligase, putative [Hondaea fermentalgiana]|uniref:HECT-type E3 ubiquitin transferase n=1 Tax=Hondaea fermentalgiana TaxID=2315210 RepID=A0A2R5GR44_9STRA|nr:Ubiquitin-protein ligase, putative [Hondaea fermentalgiana]|eukprot:GBG30354.1 Ubiquitin-protein ligase, putative [Hondaea fermentalgiana]
MNSIRRASEARVLAAAAKEQVRRELSYEDDYDEDTELAGIAELDAEDDALFDDEILEDEEVDGVDGAGRASGAEATRKRGSLSRVRASLGKSVSIVTGGGGSKRKSLRASLRSLRGTPTKPQWMSLGPSPLTSYPDVAGTMFSFQGLEMRASPWIEPQAAENESIVSMSGRDALVAYATRDGHAFVALPAEVPVQVDAHVIQVACSSTYVALLDTEGRVFVVASNDPAAKSVSVPLDEPVVQIACTSEVLVALGVSGRVFVSRRKDPTVLYLAGKALKNVPVKAIAAGAHHWVAVTVSGRVYGCGRNDEGQLGFANTIMTASEPTRMPVPFAVDLLACGDAHTVLMGRPGALLWCGAGRPTNSEAMSYFQANEIEVAQMVGGAAGVTTFLAASGEILTWTPGEESPFTITLTDRHASAYELAALPDRVVVIAAPAAAASIAREVRLSLCGRTHEAAWISSTELYNTATSALESGDLSETLSLLGRLLQDPYMLAGSFCKPAYLATPRASALSWKLNPSKAIGRADKALGSGLDVEGVVRGLLAATKAIVELENDEKDGYEPARRLVQNLLRPVTRALVKFAPSAQEPDQIRPYLLLFLSPTALLAQFEHERLVIATESMPRSSLEKLLHKWLFMEVPGDILAKFVTPRLVDSIGVYLSRRKIADASLKQLCVVTRRIYLMNNVRHENEAKRRNLLSDSVANAAPSNAAIVAAPAIMQEGIPVEAFYTRSLLAYPAEFLQNYFLRWRDRKVKGKAKSAWTIFEYGFLLSPDTKTLLLMIEDREQMAANVNAFRGQLAGLPLMGGVPYFVLEVSRSDLIRDTMRALDRAQAADLKRPLMVKFRGEDGVDAGGVKKEFFQLLAEQLFSEDYGMFSREGDTGELWFNLSPLSTAATDPNAYRMVGKLLGLAIYNATIIDMNFALAFYRTLLGKVRAKPGLRDLAELNPTLADGLRQMLEYDGDDFVDVFMCTFEAPGHRSMSGEPVPLVPGGEDMDVTRDNVKEYVDAYVRYLLVDSIKLAAEPLMQGFQMLIPRNLTSFSLFRPDELELALTGSDDFDVAQIRDNTVYEGGYSSSSPVVQWLWEIVGELSRDQQRTFLRFCTGAPKLQVGTFQLKVQRAGPDSEQLPTASTCFNILLVPEYTSKAKLELKLMLAMQNAEGFGLQ